MNILIRILNVIGLGALLSLTVVLASPQPGTIRHTATVIAQPAPSPSTVVTPAPAPIPAPPVTVTPIVNLNIHSTPEGIASNFVVTAWKGHTLTVLDGGDATWLHVRYVTTDNITVEGYVIKVLTTAK